VLTVIASDADSGRNGSLVATITVTRCGQHRAGGGVCCLRVVVVVVV